FHWRQNASVRKHAEKTLEQSPMLRRDLQLAEQRGCFHQLARAACPAKPLQGSKRIGLRQPLQPGLQESEPLAIETFTCEACASTAYLTRDGGRSGQKGGRLHAKLEGLFAPDHVVKQIIDLLAPGEEGGAARLLDDEVLYATPSAPVFAIE